MKSIKIAGLCLIAAFAFSAVAAASALAEGQPTFKACVKAAVSGTGKYNDKACTEANAESKGKYELAEVAAGTKYTGKSKTTTIVAKSESGATENIVCGKDVASIEVTEPSKFVETLTLSKCKANGSKTEPCENGAKETIKTEGINGEFYFLNAAETQLGVFSTPPVGTFKCGSQSLEVENFLIGAVENSSKGFSFNYAVSGGKQAISGFFAEGEEIVGPITLVTEKEGEPGVQYEATLAGSEAFKAKGVSVR